MTDDAMTTQMYGSAPPAPQETAGEAHDHWRVSVETSGEQILFIETGCYGGREFLDRDEATIERAALHLLAFIGKPAMAHPAPAAAPTDNTALVEVEREIIMLAASRSRAQRDDSQIVIGRKEGELAAYGHALEIIRASITTRPAEATSREGVTETARLRALLARAESFISGFEGDASQNGVDELLRDIRAGVEVARPLDEWHEDMGFVVWWKFPVEEPAWIGSPLCSDWPGYHTHFTPHPCVPAVAPTTREGE